MNDVFEKEKQKKEKDKEEERKREEEKEKETTKEKDQKRKEKQKQKEAQEELVKKTEKQKAADESLRLSEEERQRRESVQQNDKDDWVWLPDHDQTEQISDIPPDSSFQPATLPSGNLADIPEAITASGDAALPTSASLLSDATNTLDDNDAVAAFDNDDQPEHAYIAANSGDVDNELPIKKIGSGADLILYTPAIPIPVNDYSDDYYYGDEEEEYNQFKDKNRDRAGANDGGTRGSSSYTASNGDEDSSGSDSQSGGWNQADADKRQKAYLSHKESIISGHDAQRYAQKLLRKSGLSNVDIVGVGMNIHLYAQASGLVVAARYAIMQKAIRKLTEDDTRKAGLACLYLICNGLVSPRENGQAPFTNDVKGYKEFKKVLDKEILEQTGVDLSNMSAQEIGAIIKSGKLKPYIEPNTAAKDLILHNANALIPEDVLISLANTSLVFQRYIENSEKLKAAQRGQQATALIAVDQLMGSDVDLWNGTKKVRKTWRTIKKIRKIKRKLMRPSKNDATPRRTKAEYKSQKADTATNLRWSNSSLNPLHSEAQLPAHQSQLLASGANGTAEVVATTATTEVVATTTTAEVVATTTTAEVVATAATTETAVTAIAAEVATTSAAAEVTAATVTAEVVTATATTETVAATVATEVATAAAASETAAATVTAATAATSTSAIAVVAVVIAIILVLVTIASPILVLVGSIQAAFQGDRANAIDDAAPGEGKDSALYATYKALIDYDQMLLDMIEDGITEDEAEKMGLELYDDLGNYDVSAYWCPVSGRGVTVSGNKEDGSFVVGFRDGNGKSLSTFKSNAKDILSAASVVIENDFFSRPQTFKRYAEGLWYDTHEIDTSYITDESGRLIISPCNTARCSCIYRLDVRTEEAEVPETTNTEAGVETTTVTVRYFDNLSFSGHYSTVLTDSLEVEIIDQWRNDHLFIYQTADENPSGLNSSHWEEFDGEFKEGYSYRFCPGHAEYEITIITNYIDDNANNKFSSTLFRADNFTNDPGEADFWNGKEDTLWESLLAWVGIGEAFTKLDALHDWDGTEFKTYEAAVAKKIWNPAIGKLEDELGEDLVTVDEKITWAGWTRDNKEWAIELYNQDWYDVYGISFALDGAVGESVDDSQINDYISNTDNAKMADILEFAIGTVGRIPYYWGGKQSVSQKYANHQDMSVGEFLNAYYPHINTISVTSSHLSGYRGWWGCGGLDSKRHIMGLDCSGWVCFVFENFGIQLDHGTGGLKNEGNAVSFSELQPGDLLIDDPQNAHVVMFVRWDDEAHTKYTTVECAGSSGTILKKGVTKRWDYYRRIPLP